MFWNDVSRQRLRKDGCAVLSGELKQLSVTLASEVSEGTGSDGGAIERTPTFVGDSRMLFSFDDDKLREAGLRRSERTTEGAVIIPLKPKSS